EVSRHTQVGLDEPVAADGVAADVGGAVVAVVGVAVGVAGGDGVEGAAGGGLRDEAELPAIGYRSHTPIRAFVIVHIPDSGEDDFVAEIGVARAAVVIGNEGVLGDFGVIAGVAGDDGSVVRARVDYL